jgi:hypothetical protein
MVFKNSGIEIITTKDKWNKLLNDIGNFDFYHTYDYHMIEKLNDRYPILLRYVENDIVIAIPFLIRKIHNTDYSDATSVYGYSGPVSKNITADFDNSMFLKKLQVFFIENNIISVFSRLHPYLDHQEDILNGLGKIINKRKVVNIDLNLSLHKQKRNYQERLRTYVNKSRRNCLIKKMDSEEELIEFIDIYHENMIRVNAAKYFYFTKSYFNQLLNSDQFNAEILLVKDNKSGETVSGSLFVTTNNIVQYHLSGTRFESLHLTPTKLLIDEMRIKATKKGMKYFNLGGGLGGKFDDSLFKFKSSFSKDFKDFKLWNLIINQKMYDDLVEKRNIIETSFFPRYRYTDQNLETSAY